MKEYLMLSMWFMISIKLHTTIKDSKVIIYDLTKRFKKDEDFRFYDLNVNIQDALIFYLETSKTLGID